MRVDDIRRILIIGAGTMGQQIGFHCAASAFEVTFFDTSRAALDNALEQAKKLAKIYVRENRLTRDSADLALARLRATVDADDAGHEADFVSESVPEDPELKGRVLAQFNAICPARTIFTTNTSSLVPSQFAEATGRPEQFAALHFHDLRFNRVVDIMPHPGTSKDTVELIEALADRAGWIPIMLKKESPGYVFNAMLMEFLKSAQTLAASGVASVADIDRSWMGVMQTKVGPFGIMDSIGLDTAWKVTEYWAKQLGDPQYRTNADFLKQYVDKGLLGLKSGQGFYRYPGPAYTQPGFLEKKTEA